MKNRLVGVLIGQIVALVVVCVAASFFALVSFGGIAGVVIGSSPEKTFAYVAPITCPNGTVEFQKYHASYDRPGENQFSVDCVMPDGTRTDVSIASIGYSLIGIYLACFLPLCIPGGLLAIVIPLFFLRGSKKPDNSTLRSF